ncbi:MAG: hypothetical protein KAT70_06135, partial [Thermoplasmata archaeon]|nr:hypothetical protein [Thermoplasmata archaeon]
TVEGLESWTYDLSLEGYEGKLTFYARAFEGDEYSPEISRAIAVQEMTSTQAAQAEATGSPWIVLIIPVVVILAMAAVKKGVFSGGAGAKKPSAAEGIDVENTGSEENKT